MKKSTTSAKVTVKAKSTTRTKMVQMINDSKGKFFTSTHIDKDNKERTMNCQKKKNSTTELGYIQVNVPKERKNGDNGIRSINPQTLTKLLIGGQFYKAK